MEIRRLKDAGITVGQPHNELTDLADRCLKRLRSSGLGHALGPLDAILLLHDPRNGNQGVGCGVAGESQQDVFAGIAVQLAHSLGMLGKLAPDINPLIRELILKHLNDG